MGSSRLSKSAENKIVDGNGAAVSSLPEPVFNDPKHHIRVYQGDCLEILAAMPADCVDLIFADPPYFLSNNGITCHAGRMVSVNKGEWDRSRGADANHEFNRNWLAACQRVLKPNGTIWVSGTAHIIHSVGFAMQQLEFKLLNDISWVKPNPPPNLSCRYFTHATETIIWAAKNKKSRHKFNYALMKQMNAGKQMKSVWQIPPPEPWEKRFGKHPTQKPVALVKRVLLAASDDGDVVLDPFMGSGATALLALRMSRRAIGVEMIEEWVMLAVRRLCADLVQALLFIKIVQIDLDLWSRSMDRSDHATMSDTPTVKLVSRERKFNFVGSIRRDVVFAVVAEDMADAWRQFRSSAAASIEILFVIKTETEIYLAGPE